MSTLDALCNKFDTESSVPCGTSAHSVWSDNVDICKVVSVLLKEKILVPSNSREHTAFPSIHFDPLHKWDIKKTTAWIEKKKEYMKSGNQFRSDITDLSDEEDTI